MDIKTESLQTHSQLEDFASKRHIELSKIFKEPNDLIEDYEILLCRLCLILGKASPENLLDKTVRDLMADIFDFLYYARYLILNGAPSAAFPLLRRSFESISLINYFILLPDKTQKWDNGKQISNSEIRNFLSSHPMGAPLEKYKDSYKYYSGGSHPNRNFIPHRYLGEGNEFVFGSIGKPDLCVVADSLSRLIGLWFWFTAMLSVYYSKLVTSIDGNFNIQYMRVAERAKSIRIPHVN